MNAFQSTDSSAMVLDLPCGTFLSFPSFHIPTYTIPLPYPPYPSLRLSPTLSNLTLILMIKLFPNSLTCHLF